MDYSKQIGWACRYLFIYSTLYFLAGYGIFWLGNRASSESWSMALEAFGVLLMIGGPLRMLNYGFNSLLKLSKYRKDEVISYLPMFYFLIDPENPDSFQECVGLYGKEDLIICKASTDIAHDVVLDFWPHVLQEAIRLPYQKIVDVKYFTPRGNTRERKTNQHITDVLITQTLGRIFGGKVHTVVFGAFLAIALQIEEEVRLFFFAIGGKQPRVSLLDGLTENLPELVTLLREIGGTGMELCEVQEEDEGEVKIAKSLMNNLNKNIASKLRSNRRVSK